MSFSAHKGSSRHSGFTALEEETRQNRAEYAAKTPQQIAKAKDRRKRRAVRDAAICELEAHFKAATQSDPEKTIVSGINLRQKLVEARIPCPEKVWLDNVSGQTNTFIFRKDENTVCIRGLPVSLVMAKAKIHDDLARIAPKSSPLPQ